MFSTLSEYIGFGNAEIPVPDREENTWTVWQDRQTVDHYHKSALFNYYLKYQPLFTVPKYTVIGSISEPYYRYCFGDFTTLMAVARSNTYIFEYIHLLLDVYDICKGYLRKLSGDPVGISLLRESYKSRSVDKLVTHDFRLYKYNYDKIHAHTISQFSLSTLILVLMSNYLSHLHLNNNIIYICLGDCKTSYTELRFGISRPLNALRSTSPIDIYVKDNLEIATIGNNIPRGYSWPGTINTQFSPSKINSCRICSRYTEKLWGDFNSCLDCHKTKICSICGCENVVAINFCTDNYPKCIRHIK